MFAFGDNISYCWYGCINPSYAKSGTLCDNMVNIMVAGGLLAPCVASSPATISTMHYKRFLFSFEEGFQLPSGPQIHGMNTMIFRCLLK